MRRTVHRSACAAVTAVVLAVGASPSIAAEGGPTPGGGGDSGSVDVGSLYSDLVLVLRDVHGVPVLKEFLVPDETGTPVPEYCVQPISYTPLPRVTTPVVNEADGRPVYLVPLLGESLVEGVSVAAEEEDEVEACDPDPAYGMYVHEAELERLNMARQPAENMQRHLAEVTAALLVADEVTLDAAGRIMIDGAVIDAAPKYTAIFRSLMETGTIPGLEAVAGPDVGASPARVGPLDAWGIAATAIGVATGKSVPISIDAVAYYNRIIQVPALYDETSPGWEMSFHQTVPSDGELFVDYSGFRYDRAAMFPGCATWLDVPTLTWQVSPVAELADFAALPPVASGGVVTDIAGFAQMADDVRAVINVLHESDVIPGFLIDPAFQDSCAEQEAALHSAAVAWGPLAPVTIQTDGFRLTASAYLPWAAAPVGSAQLRVVVDAASPLVEGDVTAAVAEAPVAFTVVDGDLVADLWPAEGKGLSPGFRETVTLDVVVGAQAPVEDVSFRLELIDLSEPPTVLASDAAVTSVLDDVLTVMWTDVRDYAAQGTYVPMSARVLNPTTRPDVTDASLRVTVDAPEPFLLASQVGAWSEAVAMPFVLDGDGDLVGSWPLPDPLVTGADLTTTWYFNVGAGSPLGLYDIAVEVLDADGTALSTDLTDLTVAPPSEHGGSGGGGGGGGGTLPPVVVVAQAPASITSSTDAGFVFGAEGAKGFSCSLDGAPLTACTSPVTYTGLADGTHTFAVRATAGAGRVGPTALHTWTIDTVPPTIVLTAVPSAVTSSGRATIAFTTEGAVATLCSLDGAPLQRCTSPVVVTDLKAGTHTFVVGAVDAAGNIASRRVAWSVTAPPAPPRPTTPFAQLMAHQDLTGDRVGDMVAIDRTGRLFVYRGTGTGGVASPPKVGGTGWSTLAVHAPGDWNGDGRGDLMAVDGSGRLFLYPGDGKGAFDARRQIGRGWSGYRIEAAGDVNGDRRPDLLAIDPQHRLWLYPGDGRGGFGARVQLGKGWAGYELHAAGDMNRDGRADILSVDRAGRLWFYAGRGDSFRPRVLVGSGWTGYTIASGADFNRNGVPDLMGRDPQGRLWFYSGRVGGSFSSKVQVGRGW